MASHLSARQNVPQAFVSSYAPRVRLYNNALLTPIQPALVIPPIRTTKRGTTAINYSEEFEDHDLDDSDAPRRTSRRRQEDGLGDRIAPQKELGKDLTTPVEVQSIWREWMGKPKRAWTEKQVQTQAALPLHLVPIRIDLNIAPYLPEPALPKPHNARDMGLDENAAAYRQPDVTPEYRLKDYFLWNLHEALTTPDQFAKTLVDELDLPNERKQALIMSISQQIRSQLEDHASIELHPFFARDKPPAPTPVATLAETVKSREQSSTPLPGTPAALQPPLTNGVSSPATPLPNGDAITAKAERVDPVLNPDDSLRCVLSLSINFQNRLLSDKFEWSLLHPPGLPEMFAKQTCADLGLSGEWVPALSHAIYEAVLKLKKEVVDNNGSLLGVVGSGVNAWGEIENEVAEVHVDSSLMIGEGAGWRLDSDALGIEWEPKIEVLSKEEIEKREGDRERQLRRMRRDMAARAAPTQRESFYGGMGEPGGDEERMGRGERAKKKRRFKSLSPMGRDTPDLNGAFGGESGKLSDSERQYWRCRHCSVWGNAIWSVRDGPEGPRTLCNNCGLLYEQNKALPPWSKDLYAGERDAGTIRPAQAASVRPQIAPQQSHPETNFLISTPALRESQRGVMSSREHAERSNAAAHFVPNPARALSQTFYKHDPNYQGNRPSQPLTDQYAATLRGGGPQMFDDYAVDGEDLDWTKITDPRERKRLQNIINGRKYRERRLATDGEGSIGADSPQPGEGGAMMGHGYSNGYAQGY